MRMDKLTSRFQAALADAQSLCVGRDNQFIEPPHVMLAMLDAQGGGVAPLLLKAGADVGRLRALLNAELDRLPKVEGTPGEVHVSNDLNRLLNVTDKLAQQRGDQFISSELFVLAAFEDKGTLAKLFKESRVQKAAVSKAIEEVRGGESVQDAGAEEKRQALEKYTIDLTARASSGKLDPVIGRDDEIRRTIQVLQRRTKNNPVLIGEPGVGKTAIVEGLAAVAFLTLDPLRAVELGFALVVQDVRGRHSSEEETSARSSRKSTMAMTASNGVRRRLGVMGTLA